ncbi:LysM peptidoglycan-binding domain-containing protein [Methylobacter luteus]|uniref:LysM peptidoglycan-binding domain-containing protein n=1 Tax=Methylobacter luteus TaxID=415 RepID=UPI00041E7172|nr:LysM domain-containing protein [Methylobacter luteus]
MAFRTLIGCIVALSFSLNAWADEIQINPSHPDQYTVVKGDTLWDISGKFLTHPWQWPELWSYNSQIQNPHLIYPGDTIYFSMVNGRPQLSLSRPAYSGTRQQSPCVLKEQDVKNGRTYLAASESGKLAPCVRETDQEQAIKLIPTDVIAPFLSSPRVVSEKEITEAPYVVDFAGEHLLAGTGDRLYVRSIPQPETLSYTVYRKGEPYVSPETGELLGYEAKYIADATLQQEGDPATLSIAKMASEIRMGDRVMSAPEEELTLTYFPRPPEESIKGSIISVLDGVSQIGRYNVVVIDKGTADGLLPGHELDIYQNGRIAHDPFSAIQNDAVKLPDELAGSLMVFRPFERISYALVMKASRNIHVLDKVQTP